MKPSLTSSFDRIWDICENVQKTLGVQAVDLDSQFSHEEVARHCAHIFKAAATGQRNSPENKDTIHQARVLVTYYASGLADEDYPIDPEVRDIFNSLQEVANLLVRDHVLEPVSNNGLYLLRQDQYPHR